MAVLCDIIYGVQVSTRGLFFNKRLYSCVKKPLPTPLSLGVLITIVAILITQVLPFAG